MNERRSTLDDGRQRGERGTSVIEFALISSLMFMLLFGILAYGEVFADYVQLRHRVGEISRQVALGEDEVDRQTIFNTLKNERMEGLMGTGTCISFTMTTVPGGRKIEAVYTYGANGQCRIMPQIPLVPLPDDISAENTFTVATTP